jgi:hypothetical protein
MPTDSTHIAVQALTTAGALDPRQAARSVVRELSDLAATAAAMA